MFIQMIASLDPQLWWNICLGPFSRGLSFKDILQVDKNVHDCFKVMNKAWQVAG